MSKSKTKNMRDHANDLAEMLAPHVESARDKAGPMIAEARAKAGPLAAEARDRAVDKAGPAISEARDKFNSDVLPVLTAAIAAASEATEDVRHEAKKRGRATAAALKGEVEPPAKKHRKRKLLVVLGLGGLGAFVAKKMSARKPSTSWQSAYTPPPAPSTPTHAAAPTPPVGTQTADDQGGSAPDVAISDAAAQPRPSTTPDHPLEENDLTKE